MPFNSGKIKKDFPFCGRHRGLVYLDSAATSQKPQVVIDAVISHYKNSNANVHRGVCDLSLKATEAYEQARQKITVFINAPGTRNIIFVRNATEAINLAARAWAATNLKRGDEILLTVMEHHSNIVPWQMLAKEKGFKLKYVKITADGRLDVNDLKKKVSSRTRLAAFTHVSNVLGTINPIKELSVHFHRKGVYVLIDGAQAAGHMPVDVRSIGCDFYAFSGHKMYGPTGIGVLFASDEVLAHMAPFFGGGEMVSSVSLSSAKYAASPMRFEAGTPAIEAAVGLGAAVDYIKHVGLRNLRDHEQKLTALALRETRKIPGIEIYGPAKASERTGVIAFNIARIHAHDLASLLDTRGICVRAGNHCAMPLHADILKIPASVRMSFAAYTTEEDIKNAVLALNEISRAID